MLIDWNIRPFALSGFVLLVVLLIVLTVALVVALSRRPIEPQAVSLPPARPNPPGAEAPGAHAYTYQATLPSHDTHAPPSPATAAQVEQIHQDLADIRVRLAEIERILREVE